MTPGAINRQAKQALVERDGPDCAACEHYLPVESMTIDHVVPRAMGGGDELSNLQLMCKPCNQRKADTLPTLTEMTS